MDYPKTVEELQDYISNRVEESIHLDYKSSDAINDRKRNEIAKDVSAFANSDGGLILYGILEEESLPQKIDEGVDHLRFTKEWFEHVIRSNVTPNVEGLIIRRIPLSEERSAYAVAIPKSFRGPHQERESKRYYRRYNFESAPMEDYEINDIRLRSQNVPPLVSVDVTIRKKHLVYIVVSNVGSLVATDVKFQFSREPSWPHGRPPMFEKGIRFLPPGRVFEFFYHTFPEVLADGSEIIGDFSVQVSYTHPMADQIISDQFEIDLRDFFGASVYDSELDSHGEKLEKAIKNLTGQLTSISESSKKLFDLVGPTGLDLSTRTLRNIRRLLSGRSSFEKLDPMKCSDASFQEVLQVDNDLAYRIWAYFHRPAPNASLSEVEGMNDSILGRIRSRFRCDE